MTSEKRRRASQSTLAFLPRLIAKGLQPVRLSTSSSIAVIAIFQARVIPPRHPIVHPPHAAAPSPRFSSNISRRHQSHVIRKYLPNSPYPCTSSHLNVKSALRILEPHIDPRPKPTTWVNDQAYLSGDQSGPHSATVHPIWRKMKSQIQVVSTPTADSPGTTILLHFDTKRYLFGQISEGSQRCFAEAGLGVKKVSNIFITGTCQWQNVGGLIGMILTLADVRATAKEATIQARAEKKRSAEARGVEYIEEGDIDISLEISGPPNLVHSVAAARRFVFRKGLPLTIHEARSAQNSQESETQDPEPSWMDENIKVWTMCVSAESLSADPSLVRPGSSRSLSGRKRSFDEAIGLDRPQPTGAADVDAILQGSKSEAQREEDEQWVRQNVISSMFGSNWSLDKLDEIDLKTVKPPARLWVRDPKTKKLTEYSGPLPGGPDPVPDIKVLQRRPWPGALIQHLPPTKPKAQAVAYIVAMHPRRGKFDPQKAKALGLKSGPIFNKLSKGETVQNEAGEDVRPEQVLGPDVQGAGFAIVDLPGPEYVQPLIDRPEWTAQSVVKELGVIQWILGPGVASHPALQEFMAQHPDIKHVISSTDFNPNELVLQKAAKISINLAQIDGKFYPVPHFDNETLPQASYLGTPTTALQDPPATLPAGARAAERGLKFILEPRFQIQTNEITPKLDTIEIIKSRSQEVNQLARTAQQEAKDDSTLPQWQSTLSSPNTEIITLGTGSAIPSNYRNVSATLVRVPGYGNYLLDCGENTLGQLQRVFSPNELAEVLAQLRMIWISHMHADHHLGTVSLIKAWWRTRHGDGQFAPTSPPTEPVSSAYLGTLKRRREMDPAGHSSVCSPYLAVVSDQQYMHYLSEYASVEDFGYSHVLPLAITSSRIDVETNHIRPGTLTLSHSNCNPEVVPQKLYPELLGLQDILACDVKHCVGAKGIAMTWPTSPSHPITPLPFKLSYSGDCRPSRYLSVIGANSEVLIHEATFDDELKGEALAKNHSTTSEALMVGRKMGAKAVVLTHFSQRYGKVPGVEWSGGGKKEGVDGMEGVKDAVPDRGVVEGKEAENEVSADAVDGKNGMNGAACVDGGVQRDQPSTIDLFVEQAPLAQEEKPSTTTADTTMADASFPLEQPDQQPITTTAIAPGPTALSISEQTPSTLRLAQPYDPSQDMKVCVAFDYMRVKIGEIGRMQMLRPALVKLFEEEDPESDELLDDEDAEGDVNMNDDAAAKKAKANKEKQKQQQKQKNGQRTDGAGENGELSKSAMKKLRQKEERNRFRAEKQEKVKQKELADKNANGKVVEKAGEQNDEKMQVEELSKADRPETQTQMDKGNETQTQV